MRTKSLLLLAFFAIASFVWADDTIYLKNGDEIKAKVSKIATNTIEYKKVTNLEGPTYELLKSEILMVIYESGEKEIFLNQPTYNAGISSYGNGYNFGLVEYDNDKLISYNGNAISKDQYKEIAKKNCRLAYDQFVKGQQLKTAGTVCLSVGTPILATGIILTSIFSHYQYGLFMTGASFIAIGGSTMIAGIPLYCIGKDYKHKSYGTFNQQSKGNTYASELQFRINNNGVGFALQF